MRVKVFVDNLNLEKKDVDDKLARSVAVISEYENAKQYYLAEIARLSEVLSVVGRLCLCLRLTSVDCLLKSEQKALALRQEKENELVQLQQSHAALKASMSDLQVELESYRNKRLLARQEMISAAKVS